MKELYFFYNQMNKANIKNDVNSIYWLYHVENLIVKQNGVNKRYLKVRFFNRLFNEFNNLMQMVLDYHGIEIVINKFVEVEAYHNASVLGFLYEIDLLEESVDIFIKYYVMNGKKVNLENKFISKINYDNDIHKLNIINDLYFNNQEYQAFTFPCLNDDNWICCCGYYNPIKSDNCSLCGKKKNEIQKIINLNLEEIVLHNLKVPLKINLKPSECIDNYISEISLRYGIDKSIISNEIDKECLEKDFELLIYNSIHEYLMNNKITFDLDKTFDENLDIYCSYICNDNVNVDMVIRQGELLKLKSDYEVLLLKEKQISRNKKVKNIVISSITVLIIVLFVFMLSYFKPNQGKKRGAIPADKAGIIKQDKVQPHIEAGVYSTLALKSDGKVIATPILNKKDDKGQRDISEWSDIKKLSSNEYHTIGLKLNGEVVSTFINDQSLDVGQSDVSKWADIVQVSTGTWHSVGLRKDGTVISTQILDPKYDLGQSEVADWTDIVQVAAGWDHTIGLKKDGTVVTTKINNEKYDFGETDVGNWDNIVSIATASNHTVGLKRDGTVIATGYKKDGRCDVSEWNDVSAISVGRFHTIALKSDGTVLSTIIGEEENRFGQSNVSNWTDIEEVSAGWLHTIGLKSDGTIVSTTITVPKDDDGQTELLNWELY